MIKTAIVTGASRGIGLATVNALVEDGYRVAAWSRSELPIKSDSILFCPTDVSDENSVMSAFESSKKWLGEIGVLVNNAGIGYEGAFEDLAIDDWKRMFDVNVHGVFFCSRAVIPQLKAQEGGHIINISSIAGNTGIPGMAGYCGTKFAVKGISHAMYKELRSSGIKVTCIYPGSVHTNFFDSIASVELNDGMMKPEDIAETILHCLNSSPNYHHVDIEVRPLNPVSGKK